jgi:hypothetical protein
MQALNQVCVIFAARFWLARSPWALWSVLSSLRPRPSSRVTLTRSRAVPMPLRAVRTRRSSARRRTRTQSPSRSAGEVTRVQAQMRTWTRRHSGLGSVRLSRSRNEGTAVQGGGCDVRASSLRAFICSRENDSRYSSTHSNISLREVHCCFLTKKYGRLCCHAARLCGHYHGPHPQVRHRAAVCTRPARPRESSAHFDDHDAV